MKCILDKVSKGRLKTVQSASNSIFVEGKWNQKDVMVKLSLRTDPEDNGLEIERKMYMFVHSTLNKQTPHLLEGLEQGVCNINDWDSSLPLYRDVIAHYLELVEPEVE